MNFQDWEVSEFQRLLDLLQKQVEPSDRFDALSWELGSNSMFSVKSFYEKLMVRTEVSFPHSSVWIPNVPRRVCFYPWLATRGVSLTAEILGNEMWFA